MKEVVDLDQSLFECMPIYKYLNEDLQEQVQFTLIDLIDEYGKGVELKHLTLIHRAGEYYAV